MEEYRYTGAPDECNIHWPKKLDSDGLCSVEGCPFTLTSEEAELAYILESKNIHRILSTEPIKQIPQWEDDSDRAYREWVNSFAPPKHEE